MKYAEAKKMGIECGLKTPEEHIGNVEIHCTMLFRYEDVLSELKELRDDAYAIGISSPAKMEAYYFHMNCKLNATN